MTVYEFGDAVFSENPGQDSPRSRAWRSEMFLDGSAASRTRTEETSPWLGIHCSSAYPEEYKKSPSVRFKTGLGTGHAEA